MTDAVESGVPYPSDVAGPIDEWSRVVYTALHTWPIARDGEWTRWEPGYLLLTIKRVDGREIEPIALYTADEELTVSFGYWETHNPAPYELWNAEADIIAEHAKLLVAQWLNGEIRTAVVTDRKGDWCRTTTIEQGELTPQLEAAARWLRDFHPEKVEVRTPVKGDWKIYPVDPNWLKLPVLSLDRLQG
ncbi:hypothetical protein [Komagataeibacter xylinus]|uniref:Uncharacterized protein n=1 Tax=Komagataeibacter xylinus TaxID=28448 RepID=A0A857FR88_KOMXY|nr:hypothetical protein [Komagataeibacter xylinus]QHC36715.1 hypothetical protein FMA36_15440 [Komagataeibacter xylinus]